MPETTTVCFCGMDGVATCQGPCGRRLCSQHAVLEATVPGYSSRGNERLDKDRPNHFLPVGHYGYAAGSGRRCPDCRNRDAQSALGELPPVGVGDPFDRRIVQYERVGDFERFDYQTAIPELGTRWADEAARRGVAFGVYSTSYRRWERATPERKTWQFTRRVVHETGNSTATLLELNDRGEQLVRTTQEAKTGPLRRRKWVVDERWAQSDMSGVAAEEILRALLGPPRVCLRMPDQNDRSYIGLPPSDVLGWLLEDQR